jgi:hypothetical protein
MDKRVPGNSSLLIRKCDRCVVNYILTNILDAQLTFAQEVFEVPTRLVLWVFQYRRTRRAEHLLNRKNRLNRYKRYSRRKNGIGWKTKWDESKRLRLPRNRSREMKERNPKKLDRLIIRRLFLTSSFSPGEFPFSTRNLLPLSAPSCSICGSWKCIFERRD